MSVNVHLEGDGLLFDGETSVFNAAQIIGFLKNSETLTESQPVGSVAAVPVLGAAKPRVSPRQVLMDSGAKTNPQKIVVLGNYVAAREGHDGFTADEVKQAFKRAGEPLPKNFGRDMQTAVSSDLIFEEDGEDGYFILTERALEYLDTGFPEQGVKSSSRPKSESKRRNGGSTRIGVNEELLSKLKDKSSSLNEFIQARRSSYDKGASSQVAIIATWLLDEMNMKGVSASDLQTVRRHRGEPAGNPASQLNNAKNRDGYFSHAADGKFFLSNAGEDFGRIKSKD